MKYAIVVALLLAGCGQETLRYDNQGGSKRLKKITLEFEDSPPPVESK